MDKNNSKKNTELMQKHLQEQLEEIKKERESLTKIVEKLMKHNVLDEADESEKQNLEVWKQEVDEHSKVAVEHLKILEKRLEETKRQYLLMLNE